MKMFFAGILAVVAVLVGVASSGGAASGGFHPSYIGHNGAPIRYSATHHMVATGYGCGAITCSAYETGVNGYLQDVAHDSGGTSNVYSVATQYSDTTGGIAYNTTYGGTYTDTSPFPTSGCSTGQGTACLTESQLVAELQTDMAANNWTSSSSKMYIILLPYAVDTCFDSNTNDGCASNAFCAYHDASSTTIFAVEPFGTYFSCDGTGEATNPQGFPNGPEIDETVNTISHEQNEAITDPYPGSGWFTNPVGSENGDLCAWWFGPAAGTAANGQPYNQVINGHKYSLQQEFSNSANSGAGGCLQGSSATATAVSPYANDNGPLVYHNGSVMRTNTVYTIYWIPSSASQPTPELSVSPSVSGTPAVGKVLTTTTGTWTNSPTSYHYKWQRCDSTGANCVDIANATSSTYKLVGADATHEIRSEVEASNSSGPAASGYAPSATTAPVIGVPAVLVAPKLSGTPQVGSKLTVSNGTWTNAPTGYTHQWFRCSSAGTSCKAIMGATGGSYKLVSADAGHKLEAKVTAKNPAGKTTATSDKSAVVTK